MYVCVVWLCISGIQGWNVYTCVVCACVSWEFKENVHMCYVYWRMKCVFCVWISEIHGWNVYVCVCICVCVLYACVSRNSSLVQSNRPTVVISHIYKLQKKCFYLFMYIKSIWHSSKHKCNIKTLKNSWKLSELCKCYVPKNNIKYI